MIKLKEIAQFVRTFRDDIGAPEENLSPDYLRGFDDATRQLAEALDRGDCLTTPARVVIIDVETGDWLPGSSPIVGPEGLRIAASVLPGMPEALLDKAYTDWMVNDAVDGLFGEQLEQRP